MFEVRDVFLPSVKYAVKTDDSIYPNVDDILSFVKDSNRKGVLCNTVMNNRNKTKRCQESTLMYGYDEIYKLYKRAPTLEYFWAENVHVTGVVANLEGIERFDLEACLCERMRV